MTDTAQPSEKPPYKKGGLYHRDAEGTDTLIERTQEPAITLKQGTKSAPKKSPKVNKKA